MKAIFQRVLSAAVTVEGETVGQIGEGTLLLLGVEDGDTEADAAMLADKIAHLRVFTDDQDKLNLSLLDIGGEALVISNFTLSANCRHGRRPEFLRAARPETAEPLYHFFMDKLREAGVKKVESGRFGAHMLVSMCGNGPITIPMDTKEWKKTC